MKWGRAIKNWAAPIGKTLIDSLPENLSEISFASISIFIFHKIIMAALEHDMGPETLTLSRGKFITNLSNIETYWNISSLNCRCQTSLWTSRKITKKQILWWGPCNKTSCTSKSSSIWIFERCQGSLWTCVWNCRCSGQSWNSCFSHCQGKIPRKTLKWPWELTIEFYQSKELFWYKLWF